MCPHANTAQWRGGPQQTQVLQWISLFLKIFPGPIYWKWLYYKIMSYIFKGNYLQENCFTSKRILPLNFLHHADMNINTLWLSPPPSIHGCLKSFGTGSISKCCVWWRFKDNKDKDFTQATYKNKSHISIHILLEIKIENETEIILACNNHILSWFSCNWYVLNSTNEDCVLFYLTGTLNCSWNVQCSDSKRSIWRFVITEKAPNRAFSWLKVPPSTFTFKTLL